MKTAVEWFEQQLDRLDIEIPQSIFSEAKEMEKEQIIKAYNNIPMSTSAEQYYNETFKK